MKKVGLALLCLLMAYGVSTMVLYGIRNQYNPTTITGSSVQTGNMDVKKVTEQWFAKLFKQYGGPFVPLEFRIRDKRVEIIEILDKEEDFVRLDYGFRPVSDNPYVTSYYITALQESGWYVAQVVLQPEKILNGHTIKDKMSPIQYQIQTNPSLRKSPTTHYAMADRKEIHVSSQNRLYITYNAGKSLTEVPVPCEGIAGANSSTYSELFPAHGHIVDRDFTTFVCYDETGSYLQYSEDMGKAWEKSRIIPRTHRGDTLYLSKTENSCYITLTAGRSLGHEYYSAFKSSDLKIRRQLFDKVLSEKRDIIFLSDEAIYTGAGTDEQRNPPVYYIEDDGNTYIILTIPAHEVEILGSSFKSFVQMEYVCRERGITYMIVVQGTDGNYTKSNALVKGCCKSKDGIDFTFDKEISDSPILAGQMGEPIWRCI